MYCVVAFGVTETDAPTRFPGFHVNVPPGMDDVAVKFAVCPAQIVAPVAVTTACGLIVTVTGVKGDGHP